MLSHEFREPGWPLCSDRRSNHDRSSRAASRFLAGSSPRVAHSTAHRKIAGRASCRSPIRISCGAPQCEAEYGIGWVGGIRRGGAEMVSAIRVISIPLYLFRWNGNVLPVFSAFCVDFAVNVLDFSRVTVRVVATAERRMIGHVPFCIELFVQGLILWRMVTHHALALSIFLRLDWHR
jgi:hypothetical protein